jgi:hypothetical protein
MTNEQKWRIRHLNKLSPKNQPHFLEHRAEINEQTDAFLSGLVEEVKPRLMEHWEKIKKQTNAFLSNLAEEVGTTLGNHNDSQWRTGLSSRDGQEQHSKGIYDEMQKSTILSRSSDDSDTDIKESDLQPKPNCMECQAHNTKDWVHSEQPHYQGNKGQSH